MMIDEARKAKLITEALKPILEMFVASVAKLDEERKADLLEVLAEIKSTDTPEVLAETAQTLRELFSPELSGPLREGPLTAAEK